MNITKRFVLGISKATHRALISTIGFGVLVLGSSGLVGCADGNWRHYRATRYERAQEDERSVRPRTYDLLVELQKLQEKGESKKALRAIEAYENKVKEVPYEKALLAQAKAFLLLGQGKYSEAIPAIETALVDELLPEETEKNLLYNLAQIQYQQKNYEGAERALESWMALTPDPGAQDLALMAHIYYQQKKYGRVLSAMKRALKKRPEEKSWRQLVLSVHYEQKDFAAAREVLLSLLEREPGNKAYWDALASLELELKRPEYGLASLELGSRSGAWSETERMRVALLNLSLQAPQRSVRMLERGLQKGEIKESAAHWELLGNAQATARDLPGACVSMLKAKALTKDKGKQAVLALRVAEFNLHLGHWAPALEYGQEAAQSEAAEVSSRGLLVVGIASYQLREFDRSIQALGRAQERARSKSTTAQSAKQWLQLVLSQRGYHDQILALRQDASASGEE